MCESPVRIEIEGDVATITIDRPKTFNALDSEVITGLAERFDEVARDRALRCVILTGAGDKSFVAGANIAEMSEMRPQQALAFARRGHAVLAALEAIEIPVIAAVNGYCLGGGCELALACDLVFASAHARFGQPEVNLGLMPGFGGTQRLPRRVGSMRAAELTYTGRQVKADEAKAIGLCLDVFPHEELMDRVRQIAGTIAAKGPIAVRAAKRAIAAAADTPLPAGNALERESFAVLFDSEDAREGMRAFLAKRPATFENH